MSSRHLIILVTRLAITLVIIHSLGFAVTAATPNRKLSMVFADFSERAGLLFVAKDHHFFEEQGVDVDVVQVRNGPVRSPLSRLVKRSSTACRRREHR